MKGWWQLVNATVATKGYTTDNGPLNEQRLLQHQTYSAEYWCLESGESIRYLISWSFAAPDWRQEEIWGAF